MDLLHKKKKRRLWPYFAVFAFIILAAAGGWAFKKSQGWNISEIIVEKLNPYLIADLIIDKRKSEADKNEIASLIPELMGFDEPKTYLFLFQNNTELRPGGGFIGSYAVVTADKGDVELIILEGSEILDSRTPDDWQPTPPRPIWAHLGVDRWYFRDSNWSPDFKVSAEKVLELYKAEGGEDADEIDIVVAFTPTVLEKLLKIIGDVTVEGIVFSSDTAVERLQYTTGYEYEKRGVTFEERKKILGSFFETILSKVKEKSLSSFNEYIDLGLEMLEEKHIILYFRNPETQDSSHKLGWAGRLNQVDNDYLMWVDANLAALKTDHAIQRTLRYSIQKNKEGEFVATAKMEYKHQGIFDWRTSRYRTYARVFVPEGSELIDVEGSMKTDRSNEPGTVDMGRELGRQWFGTFIAIEPGQTGTLSFTYLLPESVSQMFEDGLYTLFVQKQLGTIAHVLTLDLNFDTNIKAAEPAELQSEWGDEVYRLQTDLRIDRNFDVALE